MHCSFSANADRENGFVELKSHCLRIGRVGYVELQEGAHWIELPCALPLSPTETAFLLDEFKALQAAWSVPIPCNLFKVKAGILGLFRFFIDQTVATQNTTLSPAQKLRRLIDDDKRGERNLAELSRQCNYSSEHMRKVFREQYQVSPQEYRNRQRMRRAMNLIASTELTLPEIAEQTGFRYLTHFYAAFKRTFHLTPLQGIRQFRGKPPVR